MQKILHLIGVQDSIAVLTKIGTFRQIGKGVGGMAGVSRGLWCDLKKFFLLIIYGGTIPAQMRECIV